ncbi:MAG: transporter substrate-binding domain-containing protein [Prolixibacteraceae bacterium]|nr:transporter substrate-binding domain-containing protein [Prolixibacteraceae bacterium]
MVSEDRSEKIKFGIPHSVMTHGIFTHEDKNINNLEQLRNKEIIVQEKDLMHDFLLKKGLTNKIITVENQHRALSLLSSGRYDAALLGNYQGAHLINKHNIKNVVVQNSKIEPKKYAMAVSKNNDELLWLLNMGLYQLKASGEYDEIYEKWFEVYEKKSFITRFKLPIIITISGLVFLIIMVIFLRYRIKTANYRLQKSYNEMVAITNNLKNEIARRKDIEVDLLAAKKRAEESDQLKSAFLANMSHEIRTPMNSIMGFASLLPSEESKELMAQYAKIIVQNSEQLVNIIDDIVLYSKLQTKLITPNHSNFKAIDLFEDIYQSFQLPIYPNNIKLNVNHDAGIDLEFNTDYEKIRQVFTNLISNAYKYTDEGEIEIGCQNCENDALFYVRDTGIGIPEKDIEKIFGRFYRAHNAERKSQNGTGLGLSIVKELIELLGGKIWVESKEGEGSTFYFKLNQQ